MGDAEGEGEKSGFLNVQIYGTPAEAPHDDPPPTLSLTYDPAFSCSLFCGLAKALLQHRLHSAASPHPTSMLDPTHAAPRARPAGLAQDATDDYASRDSSSAAASPRQPEIDPRRAALSPTRLRADAQRNASRGRLMLRLLFSLILPRLIPLSNWAQGKQTQTPT
jgi:hypothetical protein